MSLLLLFGRNAPPDPNPSAPRSLTALGWVRTALSPAWSRDLTALGWVRIITARVDMPQVADILPPFDATVESGILQFDFGPWLASGVTILSVQSLTIELVTGTDDSPTSRLLGSSSIVDSRKTKAGDAQVNRLVGFFPGTASKYKVTCVVNTSSGERPALWAYLGVIGG